MSFELDPLPFERDALEPHISARTVEIHYEKHHRGYVSKLEKAIGGTPAAERPLEDVIREADDAQVFNVAAQVWNHTLYWNSLCPGAGPPEGALAAAIDRDLGGLAAARRALAEAANGEFGSGWAWLLADVDGRLRVQSSTDAENPLRSRYTALLTIDVWEHAYYLDVQNERDRYVQAVVDQLLDWQKAGKRYAALSSGA